MSTAPIFEITDGQTVVDLLSPISGVHLESWTPAIAAYKGGGYFQESSLSEGRALVGKVFGNVIETVEIVTRDVSVDSTIRDMQNLRRLLEKASSYWTSPFSSEPVWVRARARGETNIRYAIIVDGRVSGDGSFFAQPFLQETGAIIRETSLLFERMHWRSVDPKTEAPLSVKVRPDLSELSYGQRVLTENPIAYYILNEAAGLVAANSSSYGSGLDATYTAGVSLDNVGFPAGNGAPFFTAATGVAYSSSAQLFSELGLNNGSMMMWVYTDGTIWTDGNEHVFFLLETDANNYAKVFKTTVNNTIQFEVVMDGVTLTQSFTTTVTGWFSILFTWQGTDTTIPTMIINLYIDGALQDRQVGAMGTWQGSTGTLHIGAEDTVGATSSETNIAHVALFNIGTTDIVGGDQFDTGLLSLLTAPSPSDAEVGTDGVFVASRQNEARLSHVYVYDASGASFGSNLLGAALPYDLFPDPLAVGDIAYFGIQTTSNPLPNGPFGSLVTDLTAGSDYTLVWEYWSGAAWSTLLAEDKTVSLKSGGANPVSWAHPSDWAATTINSVAAYWVRARISAVGGSQVTPQQKNRHPYCVVASNVTILDQNIGGDIPAQLRFLADNMNVVFADRLILGLRTLGRGESFSARINISDEQNPVGVAVTTGVNTSFQNDIDTATGRSAQYNPGGVEALLSRVEVALDGEIARQYHGTYRVFVVCQRDAGSEDDIEIQVSSSFINDDSTSTKKVPVTTDKYILELGVIDISSILGESEASTGTIDINASAASGTPNLNLYELILMPVDEWSGELSNITDEIDGTYNLDADSIGNPKVKLRGLLREGLGGPVAENWKTISNEYMFGQANADQRMWFLFSDGDIAKTDLLMRVDSFVAQQYLSARADR